MYIIIRIKILSNVQRTTCILQRTTYNVSLVHRAFYCARFITSQQVFNLHRTSYLVQQSLCTPYTIHRAPLAVAIVPCAVYFVHRTSCIVSSCSCASYFVHCSNTAKNTAKTAKLCLNALQCVLSHFKAIHCLSLASLWKSSVQTFKTHYRASFFLANVEKIG